MESEIFNVLTGGVAGSLIGAVGGVINKWQDNAHAKAMANSALAKLNAEQQHSLEMAKLNKEVSIVQSDNELQIASYNNESKGLSEGKDSKLLELADFVRSMVRPILTVLLIFFSVGTMTYILLTYDIKFTADQAYLILAQYTSLIVSCTSMALGWWFGSRKTGG